MGFNVTGFSAVPVDLLFLFALLIATRAEENISAISSNFNLVPALNSIDKSIINTTFPSTNSISHCGMKCAGLSAPSFYFAELNSTCYCNNQLDFTIVGSDAPGGVTYGYLTAIDIVRAPSLSEQNMTRVGNSSECQEIYDIGFRSDREYTTSMEGTPGPVFCNLSSLGWVIFQRRMDGSVNFYRNWTEYVAGFGNHGGEFWLGLEAIHQITYAGCELHIYLEADENNTIQENGYARYSNFSVSDATTNYTLYVDGFSGNAGNSFSYQSGQQFSTYDVDNDNCTYNCADNFSGSWWYNDCHKSNLNGLYLGGNHSTFADGVNWDQPWGYYYSLLRTEMAFRC